MGLEDKVSKAEDRKRLGKSLVAGEIASVLTSVLYIGGAMLLGQGAFKKRKYKKEAKAVKEEPKENKYAPGMGQEAYNHG